MEGGRAVGSLWCRVGFRRKFASKFIFSMLIVEEIFLDGSGARRDGLNAEAKINADHSQT